MPPRPDAIVAGHLCVDLVPASGMDRQPAPGRIVEAGPLRMRVAGCVANTGLVLAALGARVHLDGEVGVDALGDFAVAELSDKERTTLRIRRSRGASTSYSIIADVPGRDRAIWHHPGANERFDGRATRVAGARLVHLGYPPLLPLLAQDHGRRLLTFLDRARAAGATTSLDLATPDPHGSSGLVDWATLLARVGPSVDILSPSLADLVAALRTKGRHDSLARRLGDDLLAQGVAAVALSDGASGMYLRTGSVQRLRSAGDALAPLSADWADQEFWFASVADAVVTTTGAGDAASAGLAFGVLSGFRPIEAGRAAMLTAARHVAGLSPASWRVVRAFPATAAPQGPRRKGWREIEDGVFQPMGR